VRTLPEFELAFDGGFDRFLSEWFEFLRFPSISSQPERSADCRACAEWLCAHLAGMGFESRLLETRGLPAVHGELKGAPGAPTVLLYGHYDVQPVDPHDAWASPPFAPELRGGRVYARGAQDNKGQVMYVLKAVETLARAGALRPTVRVLIEGEEEKGSSAVLDCLDSWRDLIRADILMVCDTDTVAGGAPTLIMGLRGIVHASVEVLGPAHDLHSGLHGGVAPNPAQAIAELVASLHTPDGRIAVAGFCDDISDPTVKERELANSHPVDPAEYEKETGVPPVAGEPGFTPAERLGFRPSIDINGIHSGYGGEGSKTIIPARASAKITGRLAAGQDPERCLTCLLDHLRARVPSGLSISFPESGVGGPGFRLDPESPVARRARLVLDQLSDKPAAHLWEGASIPIVSALAQASGAEPVLVGFGSAADRIHAPNESFAVSRFRQGFLYAGLFLASL